MEDQSPLLVTYVLEDRESESSPWYSLSTGAELAAVSSLIWFLVHFDRYDANFSAWLESGFRKHLRRAKTSHFDRLVAVVPGSVFTGPHGRLFVSEVHRKDSTPKALSRLQLSGFKPQEESQEPQTEGKAEIILNNELPLSFGKALVAAAHAAQLLTLDVLSKDPSLFDEWTQDGYTLTVTSGPVSELSEDYISVVDSGLTEIPPGSITACARLR